MVDGSKAFAPWDRDGEDLDGRLFGDDPMLLAGSQRVSGSVLKRLLDVVGAMSGLIVLSPLLIVIAVIISLESPGSPLFRQRRTGHRGKPFVIFKFRSMRVTEDGANVVQARRVDSRVTPFGAVLRKTSFDELPQLINVLRGDMSLVGPRPHALAHDEQYGAEIPTYVRRFLAKPGITGLAQVSGLRGGTETVADMAARIDKDLEYIRTWTFFSDVRILLRTVLIFAFDPAAY